MIRLLAEVRVLLYKEWLLEWRQRYALQGLLLYVLSLAFVAALNLRGMAVPTVWNVVFWLIVVFAALNAVAKSFLGESDAQQAYLYQLAGPAAVIVAKLAYNAGLLALLALLAFGVFAFLLGLPVDDPAAYLLAVVLGALSLSSTLTLVSALAQKAGSRATLMAVLSFPLLLPALLGLARMGRAATLGAPMAHDAWLLGGLSVAAAVLSVVLFPFLWRD